MVSYWLFLVHLQLRESYTKLLLGLEDRRNLVKDISIVMKLIVIRIGNTDSNCLHLSQNICKLAETFRINRKEE